MGTERTSEQIREDIRLRRRGPSGAVGTSISGRPAQHLRRRQSGSGDFNYLHKFSALKTDRRSRRRTPNNVSIDAYGNADLGTEPVVISVAALREPRWYIV